MDSAPPFWCAEQPPDSFRFSVNPFSRLAFQPTYEQVVLLRDHLRSRQVDLLHELQVTSVALDEVSKHLQDRAKPLPHPSRVPPLHFNFTPYLHINVPHLAHINEIVPPPVPSLLPPYTHTADPQQHLPFQTYANPHVPTYTLPSSGSSACAAPPARGRSTQARSSTQARKRQHLPSPNPAHVPPAFVKEYVHSEKVILRSAGQDLDAPTIDIGAVAGYVKERYLQLTQLHHISQHHRLHPYFQTRIQQSGTVYCYVGALSPAQKKELEEHAFLPPTLQAHIEISRAAFEHLVYAGLVQTGATGTTDFPPTPTQPFEVTQLSSADLAEHLQRIGPWQAPPSDPQPSFHQSHHALTSPIQYAPLAWGPQPGPAFSWAYTDAEWWTDPAVVHGTPRTTNTGTAVPRSRSGA